MSPLHHVSYVVRDSMVGPRAVRYFKVAAQTAPDALRLVADYLGNPDRGEYAVARAEGVAEPGIVRGFDLAQAA